MQTTGDQHITNNFQNPESARRFVLVPNKRRQDLLLADAMRDVAEGGVIVHPPVQVMSQWVESLLRQILWLRGEPMLRMADQQQLAIYWQNSWPDATGSLSDTEKFLAARQAMVADRLIRQWCPDVDSAWLDRNFFTARQAVEKRKRSGKWCAADELTAALSNCLESNTELPLSLPQEIEFRGFHEWTRLETRMLRALERRGVKLDRVSQTSQGADRPATHQPGSGQQPISASLATFATPEAELQAAARWARAQMEELNRSGNKGSIAVVIQGLNQSPDHARRIFEKAFAAGRSGTLADSLADPTSADFHISYGPPLAHHALVQDALMLLRLALHGPRNPVTFPTLSACLLSPHWGSSPSEKMARASLELKLRKDGIYQISLSSLFEKVRHSQMNEALPQSLQAMRAAITVSWEASDALEQCLRTWGWPGSLLANPTSNVLIARFSALLERAQNLDGITGAERLLALQHMCLAQEQDGAGGPLSPVQLLTPEDAVGQSFSAAWVAGFSAAKWPGQPVSNPFLPADVSRYIPRGSADGELAWCERITEGLKCLAPEVIFSWASQIDDIPQAPSPLIADLPTVSPEAINNNASGHASGQPSATSDDDWLSYANNPWLTERPDGQGTALAQHEPIKGGAATISDQSASPLAAYLKHRLNARFEPMPEAFADAAWRGQLLHRALHALYQGSLGQQQLPENSDIPAAIEVAMQSLRAFTRLSPIQYRAEQQRLQRLLQDWLIFDLQRPPFRVIALEEKVDASLLGHPIQLRVDRVDGVVDANGDHHLLIIDYKSSKTSLTAWARDRLGDVQLPLYACVWGGDLVVSGLALAAVSYGNIALNGVVSDSRWQHDGMKSFRGKNAASVHKRFADWPEALAYWQESITDIAGEFIAGKAGNTVYDANQYIVKEMAPLLRQEEGMEWQRQRGAPQ